MNKTPKENIPSNVALEQSILGALLNNNNIYDKISHLISAEDFFEKVHIHLYKGIVEKLEMGQIADVITLSQHVLSAGIDLNYVEELTENFSHVTDIKQYAQLLTELASRRRLIGIGTTLINNANAETLTMEQQITLAEQSIYDVAIKAVKSKTVSFATGANQALKHTQEIINNERKISGLNPGFIELNNILGGLKPGELTILAARPSVGKTALSLNIGVNIAQNKKNGGAVLFISLEMPSEQICFRMISFLGQVPLANLLQARIAPGVLQSLMNAIDQVKNIPFFIHDASFLTVGMLRSLVRQMKRQHNIKFVVVDYLQLLESNKAENREQEISRISRSLKLIAKEMNIPILALSQMSRDIEKRTGNMQPKLSDLRGSGSIEQDADVIIFLYRANENDRSTVNMFVAKNRNGALGDIQLKYEAEYTKFI